MSIAVSAESRQLQHFSGLTLVDLAMPVVIRGPVLACLALQVHSPNTERPQDLPAIPVPKLSSSG